MIRKISLITISLLICLILIGCNVFSPNNSSTDNSSEKPNVSDNSDLDSTNSDYSEDNTSLDNQSNDNDSDFDGSSTDDTDSSDSSSKTNPSSSSKDNLSSSNTSSENTNSPVTGNKMKAVWFSLYDLNFKNKTEQQFKNSIDQMFNKVKSIGLNSVICHVRPNADAYYPSELFPWSENLTGIQGYNPGYDPMKYMVSAAHSRGLEFHAWLNPYRVSSRTEDVTTLAESNKARIWLTDNDTQNDDWAVVYSGGIYYNPAVPQVQRLIIEGVREILENYDVDGIHFDDYFYPTTDPKFDKEAYNRYIDSAENGALNLADWRRANVNTLVQSVWRVVHESKDVVFGISPSAHISADKSDINYNQLYADIPMWMSNPRYIDYIAPQLYFGFDYPNDNFKFNFLLDKWLKIPRAKEVNIYIGLAAYKIGTLDAGSDEWISKEDIIKRQVESINKTEADGFILYSYSALVKNSELNIKQLNNLCSILK